MLYLLFVLTFLAGILFYGLSPHDKGLDMSAHQAEGMIATFLAQHQAARDYLYTWLGAGPCTGDTDGSNMQTCSYLHEDFIDMIPRMIGDIDMCEGNNGTPGEGGKDACFVSKVVCTNSAGTGATGCNDSGAKHYVITYGGWKHCDGSETGSDAGCTYKRPDWWPRPGQKLRRFESWRRAIANRTRGSITCGTLLEIDGNWCIDNGENVYKNESAASPVCMKRVPPAVIAELPYDDNGKDDLLFCISEFKQGLGNYVFGATYFYDGLANTAFGQHKSGATVAWKNLASSQTIPRSFTNNNPYTALTGAEGLLNTNISASGNFTMTILLKLVHPTTSARFPILSVEGAEDPLFAWYGDEQQYVGTAIQDDPDDVENTGLISWTFVQENCKSNPANKCVSIYENAVKRSYEQITISGNLTIGVNDAAHGANIYGIRYYGTALEKEQIQQNFKVDQKRFGLSDVNNGETKE